MIEWHMKGNMIYCLKHHSWHKGEEKFENATTIDVTGDNADEIKSIILKALNSSTPSSEDTK